MTFLFTCFIRNKVFLPLVALLAPLLSWGQTAIVNYDFNSATAYPALPAATAAGINSAATSSEAFITNAVGIATGTSAYAANVAGPALAMGSSSGTNTRYFQFTLDGAALVKYSAFKLYVQGYRAASGATTLTLQYSLNGGAYAAFPTPYSLTTVSAFSEGGFDLSGLTALNAPTSLSFRLLASGASGSGPLRVDNFQVQAVNTVDPVIGSLTPATVEASSGDFTLQVGGSNFSPGAVVNFNGLDLTTTYNSSTSLTAMVPASSIATAGSYPVTVANPAAGSTTSLPATLPVTPALTRWTGAAHTSSWFDPLNWSTRAVPATTDEVLLDHRTAAGSYTVSLDQNTAVSIKSLTVNPGAGDSIFVVVPATNTVSTALLLSNTGAGAVALAIYNKGVVTNASGTATGAAGIDVAGTTGATAFIYNGGSYRHASAIGHKAVAENLSAVAGTEQGIFDLRLPSGASSSYALSTSGRNYGTLILRNRPGAMASGYLATASALNVQGNLVIGAGVTLTATINNDLRIAGDVRSQGVFQFKETSPASATSQVLLAGTRLQTISGTFLLNGVVGLAINNPAGVILTSAVALGGSLTLTSGLLTITNSLVLSPTATIVGGGSTSFINGSLARQTAAGPLTNLIFPTGSSTTYRPITLNATAQDATTYLVTQTEGPAPDYNNLPASTSALPPLTRVSQVRAYTITPTPAANNFSGTVTISFGLDDQVNAPNESSLTIGKNSGNGWQNIGNSGVSITTPAPAGGYASGTITSGTFTSFSSFALAKTDANAANPLPVTLTSFTAQRQAAAVRLRWATASELNNARFEVQRSLDGQTFVTVASVAGQGTTSQASHYSALDAGAPASLLYYRLRQVDTNGQAVSSPVVALAATEVAGAFILFPNPAHDRLTLAAPAGTAVQVLDLTGRVLCSGALPPSGAVDVQALPPGSYLLRVGQGQVVRFSKQ